MNLRIYLTTCLVATLVSVAAWHHGHFVGWHDGRSDLEQQQREQAATKLAKQTTRQQANDTRAAAADELGRTKTEVITRDVIKYVKTPSRDVCVFDTDRLSIKRAAVDNANSIAGYDDASMQTSTPSSQR